jgi:hypothetical protein
MWRKYALAAAMALAAAPAFAANWVYVGKNTYGSVYEIDMETLSRSGDTVTFWLRVKYGPDGPKGESDAYTARRTANCTDRSYRDLQTTYTKEGKVVSTTGEEEKRFAPPDSIAAGVVKAACGR